MADNEGEENMPRGNEWEVVQLTASTYAAAPGPDDAEQKDEDKVDGETSDALFYSGHFVFPPSQHENLPLDPDRSEILDEAAEDTAVELIAEEGDISGGKDADDCMFKGLDIAKEFSGIPFFDEKGNGISISGTEFDEGRKLPMIHTEDKEKSLYGIGAYSSLHNEPDIGGQITLVEGQITLVENLSIPDLNELPERDLDFPVELYPSPIPQNDDEYDRAKLPCDAWWKRTATSLYAQAKETNTFWSIFVAAAVMGLVILGQRWQQEKSKMLQLKWQISLNNESNGKLLGPIYRLKDVIVGGHRRGSLIGGGSSSEN